MHRHAIEYSRLIHNKSITVKYNTILHHNYNTNNNPYSYHRYTLLVVNGICYISEI